MTMAACMNDVSNFMYYNITLLIQKCACVTTLLREDSEKEKYLAYSYTKHFEEPVYETSLFSRLRNFFDADDGGTSVKTPAPSEHDFDITEELTLSCQSVRNYYVKIVPADIPKTSLALCFLFGVILLLFMFGILYLKKKKSIQRSEDNVKLESKTVPNVTEEKVVKNIATSSCIFSTGKTTELNKEISTSSQNVTSNAQLGITLVYQLCISYHGSLTKTNMLQFLERTVDKLFAKLDKKLLPAAPSPGTSSQSMAGNATPRLARRVLHSRQRLGSSPSLQLYNTESMQSPSTGNNSNSTEYKMFKKFCHKMTWIEPLNPDVNDADLNPNDQQLLRYFQRVCPISFDIWTCSTLITNYALMLLKMELDQTVTTKGYRFIDMIPSGSVVLGTKVGKANQFDILMVLQPPVSPCGVMHTDRQGRIPAGQVLINVQTDTPTGLVKQGTLCELDIIDSKSSYYLSGSEFYYAAEELIDMCLQSLYTKTRIQMDRLPFKINRTTSSKLSILLDTKNIVGLGLPEIKIAVYPVMLLPMEGWFQDIPIYASPQPANDGEDPKTSTKKSAVPTNFLWSLNFSEVHTSYLRSIDLKMKHAGINSCHTILLMILKSLFTGCNRNNLLDRGELFSTHISHVINFLLLESSPHQWTFDHLADRFSDTVHFLQDAFQNERLPNFYLNNPHLVKKVPFVAHNQIFQCARQQNILSDVPNKGKCLEYIEKCLRESGLKACVKEGHSPDMWEYEFFVY